MKKFVLALAALTVMLSLAGCPTTPAQSSTGDGTTSSTTK